MILIRMLPSAELRIEPELDDATVMFPEYLLVTRGYGKRDEGKVQLRNEYESAGLKLPRSSPERKSFR